MTSSVQDSLHQLEARLPELEWKLRILHITPMPHQLPRGLFRERLELTSQSCMDEIKSDLHVLRQQNSDRCMQHLALRVSQKINVLVRLCQRHQPKKQSISDVSVPFGIDAISTHQQWLNTQQAQLLVLNTQHQALSTALNQISANQNNMQLVLNLRKELGELERRQSVIKEQLAI